MWDFFLPVTVRDSENHDRKVVVQLVCVSIMAAAFFFVHFFFLLYYLYHQKMILVGINSCSLIVYLTAFALNKKGFTFPAILLINLEICLYCILNSLLIGWNGSTQWYLPTAMLPCQIIYPLKRRQKAFFLALLPTTMLVCYYLRNLVTPYYSDFDLSAIVLINTITVLCSNAIVLHYSKIGSKITERHYHDRIKSLSNRINIDPLTGLHNRHYAMESLGRTISDNSRFSVAMLDVDYFKRINDTYGHPVGDSVLRDLSEKIRDHFRSDDVAVRWGGEEFLIILRNIGGQDTVKKMEAFRTIIEHSKFECRGTAFSITITVGISEHLPGMEINQLISESDIALYYGKEHGRNQVVLYSTIPADIRKAT